MTVPATEVKLIRAAARIGEEYIDQIFCQALRMCEGLNNGCLHGQSPPQVLLYTSLCIELLFCVPSHLVKAKPCL